VSVAHARGIALGPLATFAYDIKHVTLAVLNARDKSAPMTLGIAGQQTAVIALPIVEIADHMH
jgi:hypothetical protein